MKCIRYRSNDVIARVTDDEAKRAVDSEAAVYTKKSVWRAQKKANVKDERAEAKAVNEAKPRKPEPASTYDERREATKQARRLARRKKREEQRRARTYKYAA